ncbi:MAG: hypothetical protein FVQ79_01790 [Planctomycetes bacterium]|nr:hypothetical protein [Planctomycetota bacterium]
MRKPNNAIHLTAFPLRSKTAGAIARQVCLEHFELFARGVSKVFTYNANYNELWYHPFDNFFDPPDPTQVFVAYAVITGKLDGDRYHAYIKDAVSSVGEYLFVNLTQDTLRILAATDGGAKVAFADSGILTDYLGRMESVQKGATRWLEKGHYYYFNSFPDY